MCIWNRYLFLFFMDICARSTSISSSSSSIPGTWMQNVFEIQLDFFHGKRFSFLAAHLSTCCGIPDLSIIIFIVHADLQTPTQLCVKKSRPWLCVIMQQKLIGIKLKVNLWQLFQCTQSAPPPHFILHT